MREETFHAGPLPAPETLEGYDRVVPGLAAKIIAEWQEETAHRRKFERRALAAEVVERLGSRIASFILVAGAIGGAVWLGLEGHDWLGGVLGGATIAGIATAFAVDRRKND